METFIVGSQTYRSVQLRAFPRCPIGFHLLFPKGFLLDFFLPATLSRDFTFSRSGNSSVALDCRAEGRGYDSRGRTNTQGFKITEKLTFSMIKNVLLFESTFLHLHVRESYPNPPTPIKPLTLVALDLLQFLSGNWDANSVQYHSLKVPFWARYVRIVPTHWYNHICLRVELYGCK